MRKKLMRKLAPLGVILCLPLLMAGCCLPGTVVFISDPGLEVALRETLGKPLGCLTAFELASVTELQASARGIKSLDGLENCPSLTILNLRDNSIQSITPIQSLLNLTRVNLENNEVTNIDAVAGLSNLDELILSGELMSILDFSPLVANANAARGLGDGDILVLPIHTTLDTSDNILPSFVEDYQALLDAGIEVIFGEIDTTL